MKNTQLDEEIVKHYENLIAVAKQLDSLAKNLFDIQNLSEQDEQLVFRVLCPIDFVIRCTLYEAELLNITLAISAPYVADYCVRRIEVIKLETKSKVEGFYHLIINEMLQTKNDEILSHLSKSRSAINSSLDLLDKNIKLYEQAKMTF